MSERSIQTFVDSVRNGQLQTTRAKVYRVLQNRTMNLEDLKFHLNIKHQSLTSALSWLADEGLIIIHNGMFYPSNEDQRTTLKAMRRVDRYNKWVKLGQKEGWFHKYAVGL